MSLSFEGQVAIVTGSGRGIGRAEALELARRGAAVVVDDIAREFADETVELIEAAGGRAAVCYETVATPEGGQAIVETALERFGRIDIVVNNAGMLRNGYFEDLSLTAIDEILDTHLRGAFFVTQPAWRHLKEQGYGRVVMTSSASGMLSHQGLSNYAAAKAGLFGLAKALAYEGAEHGIKVNALMPQARTTIADNDPIPDFPAHWSSAIPQELNELLGTRHETELVAAMTTYLASRECEPTGETFSICGGRYARVFVGIAAGWLAPTVADVTPEAVAEHLGEIRDISDHSVPTWLYDEIRMVGEQLQASSPAPEELRA